MEVFQKKGVSGSEGRGPGEGRGVGRRGYTCVLGGGRQPMGGARDGDLAGASLEAEGMEREDEEDGRHQPVPAVMVHKSCSPGYATA